MTPDAGTFSLRTPCAACGQPIAADLPNAVGAAAGVTRCATCGAAQPRGEARPASAAGKRRQTAGGDARAVAPAGLRARRWMTGGVALLLVAGAAFSVWHVGREWEVRTRDVLADGRIELSVEHRHADLRWNARVVSSRGEGPAPETGCAIRAAFESDGRKLVESEMWISCAGRTLYRNGTQSGLACSVNEGPGRGFGAWEYDAECRDTTKGMTLDTRARRATLGIGDSRSAIELSVNRDDAVRGAVPLFVASVGVFHWRPERRYRTRTIGRTGAAPAGLDAECRVRLMPMPLEDLPCRAEIQCGDRVVYGGFGQGFLTCVLGDGGPTLGVDDESSAVDADPELRLDVANLHASLRDANPDWSAELVLTPE